eukprot:TRINITY_DN50132_c0_g1_i1.p1 TRINITY_DN50132_c0_g1~~TRINITY_DN50132_c0_g1_i1.p1  ORF type:complete len:344 (-),score=38.82 TRINITY_DN50132_c0_g1_i1:101-1132(-)
MHRGVASIGATSAAGRLALIRGLCNSAARKPSSANEQGKSVVPPPPRQRPVSPAFDSKLYTVPPAINVPEHIPRPSYANHPRGLPRPLLDREYGERKDPAALGRMRRACGLAAEALAFASESAKVGVTTDEVDRLTSEFIIARGGYPVGINYHGFPRGLCASPNEVALHGVPNTRPLESGDIVNFDVTVFFDGAFGDTSKTVCVGDVDEDALKLVAATEECLHGAIGVVGPGVPLNEIGIFCKAFGQRTGFGIVGDYCGHFIGRELHMKPNVLHIPNRDAMELQPGMTFTIEPILIEGGWGEVGAPLAEDGWTILSKYGHWSAQSEHTVLVTEHGAEILTLPL